MIAKTNAAVNFTAYAILIVSARFIALVTSIVIVRLIVPVIKYASANSTLQMITLILMFVIW